MQVGLLCLVGLSVSYPSDERRVLRRRNSAAQIRARRPEPARFVPTVVEPPAEYEREQEEETFARRQSRPTPNKRRIPVAEVAPSHVRQDNAVAASEDSYNGRGYEAGSYESDRVKFEQSVQQSANSYNSDHVRSFQRDIGEKDFISSLLHSGRNRWPTELRHCRPAGTSQLPFRL